MFERGLGLGVVTKFVIYTYVFIFFREGNAGQKKFYAF